MDIITLPELISARSELFIVTGMQQDSLDYQILEQTDPHVDEERPLERSLSFKYLGKFHDKFRVGTFGVHHNVCIDAGQSRIIHDTWIATGDQSMRQPTLADFAIDSWLNTILAPTRF